MVEKNKRSHLSKEIRRQHNLDLMRRMRGGESLNAYDSKASWFPPRPQVKKDQKEVARVYSEGRELPRREEPAAAPVKRKDNVVQFVPAASGSGHYDEAG